MTKKTEKISKQVEGTAAGAIGPLDEAMPTWNPAFGIRRRLLEARKQLRGTKLWEQFSTERDFDAFSIHVLARGVEDVLLDNGVLSYFVSTRWQKSGATTVIEGVMKFESVDGGEVFEVACIGEAINESDKGVAMATSHARKNGFICGLNLSIGMDNEAHSQKATPEQKATTQMGGAPQQSTTKTATSAAPVNGNGVALKGGMFTFQKLKAPACSVLPEQLVGMALVSLQNECGTVTDLDDFGAKNDEEFQRFSTLNPDQGKELRTVYDMRRKALTMAGRL